MTIFLGSSQWFSDDWMIAGCSAGPLNTSPGLPNATLAMTCRCFCHSSPGSLHQMSSLDAIICDPET